MVRTGSRGFTLIELLVVIAIIAILAAILFPVFVNAKATARQASCVSSEKQIALGILLYTQDTGDVLPPVLDRTGTTTYNQVVQPYLKSNKVWDCLSGGTRDLDPSAYVQSFAWIDYGMNYRLGNPSNFWQRVPVVRLAEVKRPSGTIMLTDTTFLNHGYWSVWFVGGHDPLLNPLRSPIWMLDARHSGGANVAFLDGHIKWCKEQVLKTTESMWNIN